MENIFNNTLSMTLTSSVVIALILLIRRFIRKMPKAFSYALWAVALFRLLCPVSIGSGLSLFGLIDRAGTQTVTVETVEPAQTTIIQAEPAGRITRAEYIEYYAPKLDLPEQSEAPVETVTETAPARYIDPMDALMWVWLAGAGVMVIYGIVNWAKLRLYLLGSVQAYDNVYIADHLSTAFVMGVVFPKIYLPSDIDPTQEAHIVAHELYHIRRLDHITRLLAYAALCIHWFNPLVWAAFVLSGRDMEMSCDEGVIRRLGEDKRGAYAASLLNFAAGRQIVSPVPVSFSEGDTKRRILNIAAMHQPKRWISLLLAVACLVFTVACGADPKADPPKKPEVEAAQSGEPHQITGDFSEESGDSAAAAPAQNGISYSDPDEEYKKNILGEDAYSKAQTQVSHEATLESTPESPLIDTTLLYRNYNIFEHISSPYEFFRDITEDDINSVKGMEIDVISPGGGRADMFIKGSELIPILNAVREDEIIPVSDIPAESTAEAAATLYIGYDVHHKGFADFLRSDGHLYIFFVAKPIAAYDGGIAYSQIEYDGAIYWEITSPGLTKLFDDAYDELYSPSEPETITLTTGEPFTFPGEEAGRYKFIVPKETGHVMKLVTEFTAPEGVTMGKQVSYEWNGITDTYLSISVPGGTAIVEPEPIEQDGGTYFRYETVPASTRDPYTMGSQGLDGCTVTVTAEIWH